MNIGKLRSVAHECVKCVTFFTCVMCVTCVTGVMCVTGVTVCHVRLRKAKASIECLSSSSFKITTITNKKLKNGFQTKSVFLFKFH